MGINVAPGIGANALLRNVVDGADAGTPQDPEEPQSSQSGTSGKDGYDPRKAKPVITFQLDMTNLQDLLPQAGAPCRVGSLAMTSDPGGALGLQPASGVTRAFQDLVSGLPDSQKEQIRNPLPIILPSAFGGASSDQSVADHYQAGYAGGDWNTSRTDAGSMAGAFTSPATDASTAANPCAPTRPAAPPRPEGIATYLTQDPRIAAKETELKTSMLGPAAQEYGPPLPTAIYRFQVLPDLSVDQQLKFRSDPASREPIASAYSQDHFWDQFDPSNPTNVQNKNDRTRLKEELVTQSGNGALLKEIKAADDQYAGGQRGNSYALNLDAASRLTTAPIGAVSGSARLNSPAVTAEVNRALGPQWAAALPQMTPLEQATKFSQAVQSDLLNLPLNPAEQLKTMDLASKDEDFMRAYTYVGMDQVQSYEALPAASRANLARQARSAQLYLQTSGGGIDWGAALTEDRATRNTYQLALNDIAGGASHEATPTPETPAAQKAADAKAAREVAANEVTVAAGDVPPANGAPAVPDTFKDFIASRGIDVSQWSTLSRDAKAEAVKAAYLFKLAGDALETLSVQPVKLEQRPAPAIQNYVAQR